MVFINLILKNKKNRENFGPGAADASDMGNMMMPGDPRGSGSTFLVELQGALAALQADHFGRISAVRAPFVQVQTYHETHTRGKYMVT